MDGQTRSKYRNNQSKVHLRWYIMAIQIPARKAPGQLFSVILCFCGLLFEQIVVLGNYPSLNLMTVLRALTVASQCILSPDITSEYRPLITYPSAGGNYGVQSNAKQDPALKTWHYLGHYARTVLVQDKSTPNSYMKHASYFVERDISVT